MMNIEPSLQTAGFFEIGIDHPAHDENIGTLWRSAFQLGASGIFTIGKSQKRRHSDTVKTWQHIPLRTYKTFDQLHAGIPFGTQLIAVEIGGTPLSEFVHPARCIYLLGSEHTGLAPSNLARCHQTIAIESIRKQSYNVAVAGSLIMYSRWLQMHAQGFLPITDDIPI
jgi:tRNA G18 (ribose-2'-O)-methylase SpoU